MRTTASKERSRPFASGGIRRMIAVLNVNVRSLEKRLSENSRESPRVAERKISSSIAPARVTGAAAAAAIAGGSVEVPA